MKTEIVTVYEKPSKGILQVRVTEAETVKDAVVKPSVSPLPRELYSLVSKRKIG